MSLDWISNTIYVSKIRDAGPIYKFLHDIIELLRSKNDNKHEWRRSLDLEFLHITACYYEKEYQVILHVLSSESIIDRVSGMISNSYSSFNIKCVEIDSDRDMVNLLIHEKGELQNEKTVPKGLSSHLIEELERSPMQGRCFSFTVPELFNQSEGQFIARLAELKYNKQTLSEPDPDITLEF